MTSDPTVIAALAAQRVELPSWAFGNSGTRFKVQSRRGLVRSSQEIRRFEPRATAARSGI